MPDHDLKFREMVEEIVEFVGRMADAEQSFGACEAIAQHGKAFAPRVGNPAWLRIGQPRDCFNNATRYAVVRDDVHYAEGYALEPGLPIPVHHAWLVDRDGFVIDPTWANTAGHVYFGIPFRSGFVREQLTRNEGQAGILVNLHLIRRPRRSVAEVKEVIVAGIAGLA